MRTRRRRRNVSAYLFILMAHGHFSRNSAHTNTRETRKKSQRSNGVLYVHRACIHIRRSLRVHAMQLLAQCAENQNKKTTTTTNIQMRT